MAQSFGVSVDFIDSELADFIVAGRLTAKIDKVAGVVETNRCVNLSLSLLLDDVASLEALSSQFCRMNCAILLTTHSSGVLHLVEQAVQGQFCADKLVPCRPDAKNAQYQQTIKHGDLLLNRLQRLSKVVDLE